MERIVILLMVCIYEVVSFFKTAGRLPVAVLLKDVRAKIFQHLRLLPLKADELLMSEMQKKMGGHRLRLGENKPERSP